MIGEDIIHLIKTSAKLEICVNKTLKVGVRSTGKNHQRTMDLALLDALWM